MPDKYSVEGKVYSRNRPGTGGLRVRIFDKEAGYDDVELAAATTDSSGHFAAPLDTSKLAQRNKTVPDVQARVYAADGKTVLGASPVRYDAGLQETLDVLLPDEAASSLPSEFEALVAAIAANFQGKLTELKETGDRQDFTHLARKTGWDARAIALAALSAQLATTSRIEAGFLYALFRAGVATDESTLYRTDVSSAAELWAKAIEQGVIPANLKDKVAAAKAALLAKVQERSLADPAGSPLNDLLALSFPNAAERQRFAKIRAESGADPKKFWAAVDAAFPAQKDRLKLNGQLGYLTLNNAALVGKLHAAAGAGGLRSALALAHAEYFRPEQWLPLIGADPVPVQIPGANDIEKRANYAAALATEVRLSFPTASVAQMIRANPAVESAGKVAAFLLSKPDFEIGRQSIEQYLAKNRQQVDSVVLQQVKRIQRIYQITPSDAAMNELLAAKLDSAYAVVRYGRERFVARFKDKIGEQDAKLAYAKAQQVHGAVLGIAASYVAAANGPGIGVHSPAQILDPSPVPANTADVIAYASLEKLFGSMDYCACEHCRSVLGPAAYLVDLLHFLDRGDDEWREYVGNWKPVHGGAPYPFADMASWNLAGNPAGLIEQIPLNALSERRPDIQSLLLTCENTSTPLPYLDIVNETLEYFVANQIKPGSLNGYQGHDTGPALPAELAASPGSDKSSDKAYDEVLRTKEKFPAPLPFHQPLEALRRYFARFEVPLPQAMEVLRKNEDVNLAGGGEYNWRDIWMETLGLSREEYALLTDRGVALSELYGFALGTSKADMLGALSKAQAFTRRVGIAYEQIFELLKTRFVNPASTLIPRLERLHVKFSAVDKLKKGTLAPADFNALLPQGLDPAPYGGDIQAWLKDNENYKRIMGMIVVANPLDETAVCKLDQLELRYADPDNAANKLREFEFLRIARFLRLWRKLGWSIQQTDQAITALYPVDKLPVDPSDDVNKRLLDEGFAALLPRLGVLKRVMDELSLTPGRDLASLLACFAPIDTHGESSFYRRMFLNPAFVKAWPAFADDGYGRFLADDAQKVLAHAEAVRAACQLTGEEFGQAAVALGFDAQTPLTVDNVSALYRRGWLAKKLRLSMREFLALTTPKPAATFTGIDPFAAPEAPSPPILSLIHLVKRLRAASLKPAAALYLAWNQDVSGKSAPDERTLLDFARGLRAALAAIDAEFDLRSDPDGQIARARMALVYGAEAADTFFGLLEGTLKVDTPLAKLEAPDLPVVQGEPSLTYEEFRRRLCFTGILTDAKCNALKGAANVSAGFKGALDELLKKNRAVVGPLFYRYPELEQRHAEYSGSAAAPEERRTALLAKVLPALRGRRKRQQALQAAAGAVRAEFRLAAALLDDKALLHAAGRDAPALEDLVALERCGLSAKFYFRATATGNVDKSSDAEANLAYDSKNKLPNAGNAVSGVWSGYLEVPENGLWKIEVQTDAAARVAIALDDKPFQSGDTLELKAGALVAFSLTVTNVKDALDVRWQLEGRGRETIPTRFLYPDTLTANLRAIYVRFLKAASLAAALKLNAAEMAHFASRPAYAIAGEAWLNRLPVSEDPDKVTAAGLLKALCALLDFARIKAELSPDDARLLEVLKDPATKAGNELALTALTRWDEASLDTLLTRFGQPGRDALKDLAVFGRVHEAFALMKKVGVSAAALAAAATNQPTRDTVRGLQAALRARYAEADWLNVLKPINDELRALQRDALVACILSWMSRQPQTAHVDTADKLFEYFLMDVQMDPCALTSRVRCALSSVQLFIDRCLMNLEPRVSPVALSAKQWAWMKRYRVWEANRKIFLYPENWLEPELRDDQSPFFKEAMGELLQSDLSEDSAAGVLLNYLERLEDVAKLEPCGIHYLDNDEGTEDDVAHVVARTAGAKRKYYYRQMRGGNWLPWEEIKLDIEDNPVYPVVWKDRLFVFWFKLIKEAVSNAGKVPGTGPNLNTVTHDQVQSGGDAASKMTVRAVLCWSERYHGKWQPTRTSDPERGASIGTYAVGGFDRSRMEFLRVAVEPEGALSFIALNSPDGATFSLFNTHSLPLPRQDDTSTVRQGGTREILVQEGRSFLVDGSKLAINYGTSRFDPAFLPRPVLTLKGGMAGRVVAPGFAPQSTWDKPFLFSDSRHVFWVTTTRRVVEVQKFMGYAPPMVKPDLSKVGELVYGGVDRPWITFDPGDPSSWPGGGAVDPVSPWIDFHHGVDIGAGIGIGIGNTSLVRIGNVSIGAVGAVNVTNVIRGGAIR